MRKRPFCTSKSIHGKAKWAWSLATPLFMLNPPGAVYAHGFGQRYDLPVPLWLYVTGAATAVVFSFVVVAIFLRGPSRSHPYPRYNLLRSPLGHFLTSPAILSGVKLVSVALFVLLILTGLFGNPRTTRNLTPTLVWVIWWVGLAYVSALVGNLWALINPWKILFEWAEWLNHRVTHGAAFSLHWPYPQTWGAWPGVVLFVVFAWIELAFEGAALPGNLAGLILLYSALTWTGMFLFGKDVWLRYGEAFSLVFGLLARFAPTEVRVCDAAICQACRLDCRDDDGACIDCYACFTKAAVTQREWNLRPYAVGLARPKNVSVSEMVFVLVLLATITFDGFTATPLWADIVTSLWRVLPAMGGAWLTVIKTLGLLVFPLVFLEVYVVFSILMATLSRARITGARLTRTFALTLVPIAIGYHIAHYLTFLLIQGQRIIPLASDPFGFGWNLLRTAGYRINIGLVDARFAWYTAVMAIVVGHIIAVYLAHLMALRTLRDHTLALRSQYPMLVLMVGYTMISLWILAQPIVESRASVPTVTARSTVAPHEVSPREQAAGLIAALSALPQKPGRSTDVEVRSSLLCFCLNKGPETIQELRRLAGEWFAKGLTAFTAKRHQEAIAAFTKAMQLNPRDVRAYINRGIVYAKTRHYRQARADFTHAVALNPQRAEAYYAAGLVSVLLDDAQQAEQNFQVATQLGYEPARFLYAGTLRRVQTNGVAKEIRSGLPRDQ
jgi:tetratricopeptide (TPR) repeat protein